MINRPRAWGISGLALGGALLATSACELGGEIGGEQGADLGIAFDRGAQPRGGEQRDELKAAGRQIGRLAAECADLLTGVRLEGEDELVVALPDGDDLAGRQEQVLDALEATGIASDVQVRFEAVKYSRANMDDVRADLRQRIIAGELDPEAIAGIGEDPSRGVVVVYATADSDVARQELKDEYDDAIVFREAPTPETVSRTLDPAPHIGGAGYTTWNQAHTDRERTCSTAFPVTLDGVSYMLTAGHCLPAWDDSNVYAYAEDHTGTSSTYYFGKRNRTTMGNSEDTYGDFALLKGSTYRARVYVKPDEAVDVGEVDWGAPSMNEQVCRSGRTTGKWCRLFITDPSIELKVHVTAGSFGVLDPDARLIAKMAEYRSDQDLNDYSDCNVGKPGDSGGAIFQWAGAKARAMGIMTAIYLPSSCNSARGYYTRLSGPRAQYPTITMPLR